MTDKKNVGNRVDDTQKVTSLSPETLLKLMEIALEIRKVSLRDNEISEKELKHVRPMLIQLMEYMIVNIDNPNIDLSLLKFIEKLLGIDTKKSKEKKQELEEEREEELSEEIKQHRFRMAMYEVHKILNPNRLAGETDRENFINNVRTRGIEVAKEYSSPEHMSDYKEKELEALESYRHSFVDALKSAGYKGGGRGL